MQPSAYPEIVDAELAWREALDQYSDETGIDLRRHDLTKLARCETVEDILADIEDEMDAFKTFDADAVSWINVKDLVQRISTCVLVLDGATVDTSSSVALCGKAIIIAVVLLLVTTKGDLVTGERYKVLEDVFMKLAFPLERMQIRLEVKELRPLARKRAVDSLTHSLRILALATSRNRSMQWTEKLSEDIRVQEAVSQLDQMTIVEKDLIEAQDYTALQRVLKEIQVLRDNTQARLYALQDTEQYLREVLYKRNARRTMAKKPKPHRGLSAYMYFSQDHREIVKKEYPDVSFGEIGPLLGQKWQRLSDEDKKPWVKMAAEDKARYEREMKEYEGQKCGASATREYECAHVHRQ